MTLIRKQINKMKELEKLVYQALGEASMCWSEVPRGIFQSDVAVEIGKKLISAIQALSQSEWIKVEQRLPDDDEWYQVSNGKEVYTLPHIYRENEGWLDYHGFPAGQKITYYRLIDLTPPQTK